MASRLAQPELFDAAPALPEGLRYLDGVVASGQAERLVGTFGTLPFEAFDFHGFKGNRRVVSYGWRYDFSAATLRPAEPMPDFLLPLREAAAEFAGIEAEVLQHALVTEYAPGAGIGWHRDRPEFDKIVGLSFVSPATLRLRRHKGQGWERAAFVAEPRSAYLLDGPARTDWQHSITPGAALRYSVTFRSFR